MWFITHLLNGVFLLILQWWTAKGLFNGKKRSGYWLYIFFSINRSFETGMDFFYYVLTSKSWKLQNLSYNLILGFLFLLFFCFCFLVIFRNLIKMWDTPWMLVLCWLSCTCGIRSILHSCRLHLDRFLKMKYLSSILNELWRDSWFQLFY